MEYNPSYQVNIENKDVVVRFRRDLVDETTLGLFLDYLELESIRKRSKLTEEQAAELAKEIDAVVWEKLKPVYLGE
jgi:hypothetical protein